jgi:hypothetical protein
MAMAGWVNATRADDSGACRLTTYSRPPPPPAVWVKPRGALPLPPPSHGRAFGLRRGLHERWLVPPFVLGRCGGVRGGGEGGEAAAVRVGPRMLVVCLAAVLCADYGRDGTGREGRGKASGAANS